MDAYVLKVDGTKKKVMPNNGTDFTLREMYNLIGCDMIEIVYLRSGRIMIVDEEGLLKQDSEYNFFASVMVGSAIVGDVLVCDDEMVK